MQSSTGVFSTPHGSKYIQQLSKHFLHKANVTYDLHSARVLFEMGRAEAEATPHELRVRVYGEDEIVINSVRKIIESHLVRFAFRENFTGLRWDPVQD